MISEFLNSLGDLFSGEDNCHHDISNGFFHSGIDLSSYSTEEIQDAFKYAFDNDSIDHSNNYAHGISFGSSFDVDARNLAKSDLLDKMSSYHINTSTLYTDKLWGGLDSYSGDKVYDAINEARDNGRISDSVFRDLMSQLKKACHNQ